MYEDNSFVIFSPKDIHCEVNPAKEKQAVSAGYVSLFESPGGHGTVNIKAYCFGESTTMGLKSREKDSEIISNSFKL